jgi:hypothetical protein
MRGKNPLSLYTDSTLTPNHPKHVEQLPDINKLCNFASRWVYIRILLPSLSNTVSPIKCRADYKKGIGGEP